MTKPKTYRGSCICGAVKFHFKGKLDDVWFCHCDNCRKNYGMYGAFAGVMKKGLVINGAKNLVHYKSRAGSIRSFCKKCGSPITWDWKGSDDLFVLLGALNGKVKAEKAKHIWMSDKGGYYEVKDKWPKYRKLP